MSKYYTDSNQRFINPYHFVPTGEKCQRKESYSERKSKGKYTGWIDITLTNISPLFIPNSSNNNVFNHRENGNSYDFFSYTDLSDTKNPTPPKIPVIPGSELKGIIRTAYETLTDSCFSSINKDTISRRYLLDYSIDKLNAAIIKIENNNYILYKCDLEKYPINDQDFKDKKHGDEVKNGYFFKGEDTPRGRKNYYVFVKNGKGIKLTKEEIENFEKMRKDYKDSSKNIKLKKKEHSGYKDHPNNMYLVFYRVINGKKYFSFAQIGREAYYNKPIDILKQNGEFQPCDDKDNLCEACLLFGFVAENKKNQSAASKVRFTDLIYSDKKEPQFYEPLYLKELASPKPEAVEFYLKKPPAKNGWQIDYWTYDYAIISKNANISGRKKLQRYYDDSYKPAILGRKFYWHNIDCTKKHFEESQNNITERNVLIRPLKSKHTFKGKIYFEKLTELELKRLLWILTFGDNKEYAHKIGMGKPYGLGSVQIDIDAVHIRRFKTDGLRLNYIIENVNFDYQKITHKEFGCLKRTFDAFKKICSINPKKEPIDYPRNEGEKEIFKWFAENRNGYKSKFKIKIKQDLTTSSIEKPQLRKYKPIQNNPGKGRPKQKH